MTEQPEVKEVANTCDKCKLQLKEIDIAITKCNHKFHVYCLFNSIKYSGKCSVCKETLIPHELLNSDSEDDVEYTQEELEREIVFLEKAAARGWLDRLIASTNMIQNPESYEMALQTAINFGNLDIIKHLIRCGTEFQDWMLYDDIEKYEIEVIKYLLNHGLSVDKLTENLKKQLDL